MSARYSKTSSRGRSMVMLSSTGSTTPGVLPRTNADGALVLRRAHELGPLRSVAAARAAQLADDRLGIVVDALAHQGGPVAVGAQRPLLGEQADALAQQGPLDGGRRRAGNHVCSASPPGTNALPNRPSGRDPIDLPVSFNAGGRVAGTAHARARGETDGRTHAQRSGGDRHAAAQRRRLGAAHPGAVPDSGSSTP